MPKLMASWYTSLGGVLSNSTSSTEKQWFWWILEHDCTSQQLIINMLIWSINVSLQSWVQYDDHSLSHPVFILLVIYNAIFITMCNWRWTLADWWKIACGTVSGWRISSHWLTMLLVCYNLCQRVSYSSYRQRERTRIYFPCQFYQERPLHLVLAFPDTNQGCYSPLSACAKITMGYVHTPLYYSRDAHIHRYEFIGSYRNYYWSCILRICIQNSVAVVVSSRTFSWSY